MFLPRGVSSTSDWLPGYGHCVPAPEFRSQTATEFWLVGALAAASGAWLAATNQRPSLCRAAGTALQKFCLPALFWISYWIFGISTISHSLPAIRISYQAFQPLKPFQMEPVDYKLTNHNLPYMHHLTGTSQFTYDHPPHVMLVSYPVVTLM